MTFTLDQIDKGIYEALRLVAVVAGYLPDITVHTNKLAYDTALQAIKTAGKQPINLYGVGAWKAKEQLKFNTIVVERTQRELSTIGYNGTKYYEPNATTGFDVMQRPIETASIKYNVSLVARNSQEEKELATLIGKALGTAKTHHGYNDNGTATTDVFWVFREQIVNLSDRDFIEYQFRYKTSELFLEQDIKIDEVHQLNEIHLDVQP